MATEMPAETDAADERWRRMWSHREQLLKVARRRSMSQEDAEDAVHDAMLRAAERPDLDEERLGAWLTTVTMRLCVDRYRQVNREAEVRVSPRSIAPGPVPVEEAVCDRAEAKWLAVRSAELPARQAEALWLKSEDLDVGQVAVKMGLSYRTVESLLARARRTLRNSLAATLGFVLFLLGRGRLKAGGKAQAVAAASTAATLAVAGFVLPYALDGGGATTTAPHPSVAPGAGALRPGIAVSTGTSRTRQSPAPSATSTTPPAAGAPGDGTQVGPLSVPPLPQVAAPTVPKVPGVPDVPKVSGLPTVTDLPDLPTTPVESAVPTPALPSAALPTSALSALPSAP
ncbi:RNA polymerase sigma factor [Streptomyces panaciradicis]|uniref:RNA polymerase sigma factor n=1 Tax=Streptomyces panaciradicis TaxID=1470261 RepID=UPI00201CF79D|nr:sigma-70 family RNA polymerase sigma factor [Streptomyces panaciradicis]MCL6672227.1 sigma-70 family RNA polymerase sigma factor [Streptomyces panaciradicis]